MMTIKDGFYIGVDGCKGGWIACILDHGDLLLKRFDSLEALTDCCPEFDACLAILSSSLEAKGGWRRDENGDWNK